MNVRTEPVLLAVFLFAAVAVVACSSGSHTGDGGTAADGGIDQSSGGTDCGSAAVDASFTCDVSSVPAAERFCGDWIGMATIDDSGGMSCPGGFDWSGGGGRGGCSFTWDKAGPPDICKLPPSDDGIPAFQWLHPACDAGCQ